MKVGRSDGLALQHPAALPNGCGAFESATSDIKSGRAGITMPRDFVQGLTFMLGLLLAFYLLTPFLERAVR